MAKRELAPGTYRWRILQDEVASTKRLLLSLRYAVYDLEYDAPGGEGKRSKITFIAWSPDNASLMVEIPVRFNNQSGKKLTRRVAQNDVFVFERRPEAVAQRSSCRHPSQ